MIFNKQKFLPYGKHHLTKRDIFSLFKVLKGPNLTQGDYVPTFEKSLSNKVNSKYDVAVGLSGGVDSCTTAYLAQKAGLRVLAVHMDNCWDTPVAVQNINKLISLENVDYCCEVLDWNKFRSIQRILIESGLPDIELPTDSAIAAVLARKAVQYGVKTILSGGNNSSEGILPSAWMYNTKDSLFIKSIFQKAGKSVDDVPEAVTQALTRDYSDLMKAMNKKGK